MWASDVEFCYKLEVAQAELHFSLPSGAYATSFLEQVLKQHLKPQAPPKTNDKPPNNTNTIPPNQPYNQELNIMNFQAILQKNALKTYAVLLCYVAIFLLIGLLVDIVRINAPSLEYGFYLLLSFKEFPLITALTSLVAVGIIMYSISRFDVAIMLAGDEYEAPPRCATRALASPCAQCA